MAALLCPSRCPHPGHLPAGERSRESYTPYTLKVVTIEAWIAYTTISTVLPIQTQPALSGGAGPRASRWWWAWRVRFFCSSPGRGCPWHGTRAVLFYERKELHAGPPGQASKSSRSGGIGNTPLPWKAIRPSAGFLWRRAAACRVGVSNRSRPPVWGRSCCSGWPPGRCSTV